MNKTAIKNFAIWARNKLITDISYKAGLLGITEKGIKSPLPQSTQTVQFFDIGTKEPSSVTGVEIQQRKRLVEEIERKAKQSDYTTAYKNVIEEVAYTWFNRLIAIRFMEVNDYLPTRIRVLSSESNGKAEPDLVTHALEANLEYSAYEKDRIIQLKHDNKLDELFRMLFIKQCNALNANLPKLFEKTSDYTELLLNVSFTDKEGVVYHLVNDISEDDFNVSKEGQVEIIGWLYQYYNTEPKDDAFALLKKNVKITKERIPAATQLFTPDWIVRYMVENSLGRLWLEGHPNDDLKLNWKYYLDEVEQQKDVQNQLIKIREEYKNIKPEDIKVIDPAMGSGHILVYAFDVLMQIYESYGFSQRDAAKSIIENNLYGLDIDNRAYQLAYFAVMMKARQYNRRILNGEIKCHVYSIQESNSINRNLLRYFGSRLSDVEKNTSSLHILGLLDAFKDAKEFGSIITVENYNWDLLRKSIKDIDLDGQLSLDSLGIEITRDLLELLIDLGETMAGKYDVVVTNPPYMSSSNMNNALLTYVKEYYPESKSDMSTICMEVCLRMCKPHGYMAMINIPVWMLISSYEGLRNKLLNQNQICSMLHFGRGVFGSDFGTTSFVMAKSRINGYLGVYRKLHTDPGNVDSLDQKQKWFFEGFGTYYNKQENFAIIPTCPIAYWLSQNAVDCFKKNHSFGEFADPRQGLATGNDNAFLRAWFEVEYNKIITGCKDIDEFNSRGGKYAPFNKGGAFKKWYGNNNYVIKFDQENYQILLSQGNHLPSRNFYFRKGITWSALTAASFSGRYCDFGFVFAGKGPMCFPNDLEDIYVILAFLNSRITSYFIKAFSSTTDFNQGPMRNLPYIPLNGDGRKRLDSLARECVNLAKSDWDRYELSWDFESHPYKTQVGKISDIAERENIIIKDRFKELKTMEEEINTYIIQYYTLADDIRPKLQNKEVTASAVDVKRDVIALISYAVGCMFGRYSLGGTGLAYAGGMWNDSVYKRFIPDKDNILPVTDEEYFEDDIIGIFCKWLAKAYGVVSLEENLDFIAKALGKKGNTSREIIRNYFLNDFFKDHSSTYTVTGSGKRPIYWLFDSGKQNGFKALIYMHRYDENTIGNLRIDYLHRMQRIYENEIARMQDTIENSRDAREVATATKRKEKLIKQLQETKEYDEKIAHLALARTSIDLDDGVKVNYEKVQTDRDGKKFDVLAKI